jgi:hypothetical protein
MAMRPEKHSPNSAPVRRLSDMSRLMTIAHLQATGIASHAEMDETINRSIKSQRVRSVAKLITKSGLQTKDPKAQKLASALLGAYSARSGKKRSTAALTRRRKAK